MPQFVDDDCFPGELDFSSSLSCAGDLDSQHLVSPSSFPLPGCPGRVNQRIDSSSSMAGVSQPDSYSKESQSLSRSPDRFAVNG
jgi:hypothetical protein